MYSTKTDPAKSSQVLIKLVSELLRYRCTTVLEAAAWLVADINFLADFLNLEKISG